MSTSNPVEDIEEGSSEGEIDNETPDKFNWNIQLTVIIVVMVGLLALGIFLLSFWLSRRKSGRKMLNPPSRMQALWTNIQILPLKTSQFFERRPSAIPPRISSQARNMDAFQEEANATDDSSPIFTEQGPSRHQESCTNMATIQPDPESSDVNYEDAKADLTASMYDLSPTVQSTSTDSKTNTQFMSV